MMFFRSLSRLAFGLCCVMAAANPAAAQNTGGVFGPVVNPDDISIEYRGTVNPETERVAQRLHVQRSINNSLRPRILVQGSSGPGDSFNVDFIQAELLWDLTSDDSKPFQTALRFDGQVRTDDGADLLGINWINQLKFGKGWQARFLVLSAVQLGDASADGVFLQTRANLQRKLTDNFALGGEIFNFYGSTDNFPDFDDQVHQIGPYGTLKIGGGFSLFGGALFGLTGASPDSELRLWVTKSF